MFLWWIVKWIKAWFARESRHKCGRRILDLRPTIRSQPKPTWVTREIIRLKALMPDAGCRTIANIFNRRYTTSRNMMWAMDLMGKGDTEGNMHMIFCQRQKTFRIDASIMKM